MLSLLLVLATLAPLSAPPGYERAWDAVPERHRLLVRSIHVDRDSGGQARRATMSVHLVPKPRGKDSAIWHELGHIVRWSSPALSSAWDRQFWPDGRIRGIPPSRYAMTEPDEDFAESYEEILEHGCLEDADRTRFMIEWAFRPGELVSCRP